MNNCPRTTAAETFSIMTEAPRPGSDGKAWRLTARGTLTELGGQIAVAAVSSVLGVGARQLSMDLTRVTSAEYAGLRWLRHAFFHVQAFGGQLSILGTPRSWDRIAAGPPGAVPAGRVGLGARR